MNIILCCSHIIYSVIYFLLKQKGVSKQSSHVKDAVFWQTIMYLKASLAKEY